MAHIVADKPRGGHPPMRAPATRERPPQWGAPSRPSGVRLDSEALSHPDGGEAFTGDSGGDLFADHRAHTKGFSGNGGLQPFARRSSGFLPAASAALNQSGRLPMPPHV